MITLDEYKNTKIEPCPFCGENAEIEIQLYNAFAEVSVFCTGCGSRGPQYNLLGYEKSFDRNGKKIIPAIKILNTRHILSAVSKWNARAVK